MVKRCSYGLCKSDDRYPERLVGGVKFVPFPKPKTNLDKCLRWIRLCGRPHKQLRPCLINSNKYVCTKHFVNQTWPTLDFPDPVPSSSTTSVKPARRPPLQRQSLITTEFQRQTEHGNKQIPQNDAASHSSAGEGDVTISCQTDSKWVDPMDLMSVVVENEVLRRDLAKSALENLDILRDMEKMKEKHVTEPDGKSVKFSVDFIIDNNSLMKYYTGFTKGTFQALYKFLVPKESSPLNYVGKGNLSQINRLSLQDQVFLTLCKLRNNFDMQDLGFRFSVTQQVASVIFNSWVSYMFLRFGEICIWPHRDILFKNMPDNYKEEFPNTFVIADCTEIKIQKPSSLKAQSQTYSDYKSCNTLKALVAVDPRGSVIFSSMLFAGAISDKEIFKKSGFQLTIKQLVEIGYLQEGDGIMADKGFDIVKEVEETGLKLNIPPFAKAGTQMNARDVVLTQKIAKHRVHVERAIRRIKSFKILSGRIALSMLSSVDQIWYVCSVLTNFMPPCIKMK